MNPFEARLHRRLVAGSHIPAIADVEAIPARSLGARRTGTGRKVRHGSLPAPPSPRYFGIALCGTRLFIVEGDARGGMNGAVHEHHGDLRSVEREDVKRLGVVTTRRFRLVFVDGTEVTLDTEATKGVARFLDYLSALVVKDSRS